MEITLETYLTCSIVALLGAVIRTATHYKGLLKRAQRNNLEFGIGKYFKLEAPSMLISVASIGLCLFFITNMTAVHVRALEFLNFVFAFIGYASDHIVSKLAGVASKKIDAAIDHKTTTADITNGTTDAPTPI